MKCGNGSSVEGALEKLETRNLGNEAVQHVTDKIWVGV